MAEKSSNIEKSGEESPAKPKSTRGKQGATIRTEGGKRGHRMSVEKGRKQRSEHK